MRVRRASSLRHGRRRHRRGATGWSSCRCRPLRASRLRSPREQNREQRSSSHSRPTPRPANSASTPSPTGSRRPASRAATCAWRHFVARGRACPPTPTSAQASSPPGGLALPRVTVRHVRPLRLFREVRLGGKSLSPGRRAAVGLASRDALGEPGACQPVQRREGRPVVQERRGRDDLGEAEAAADGHTVRVLLGSRPI